MPSLTRIYVPADSSALALGADDVATAIAAEAKRLGIAVGIVRNGSRGMHWLEPLVEVQTAAGRIGYGPVAAADVAGLFKAGWLEGGAHPLRVGPSPVAASSIPFPGTTTPRTVAGRAWRARARSAPGRRSKRSRPPACAGAGVRVSPRASSGARSTMRPAT